MKSKTQKVYRVKTVSREGCQVEITARNHTLIADEPKPIGTDEGMTPVELLLGALGSCKSLVFKSTAHKLKIPYTQFEISLEGDFDSAGYLGDPTVAIGFSAIRTIYDIDTIAPEEDIQRLITYVESHCPVAATIDVTPKMESILNYNQGNPVED